MPLVASTHPTRSVTLAILICLITGFGLLSFASALTKSPTADEPLHAVAGFVRLHELDFRVDPEDPPLFTYWAMIPQPRDALHLDTTRPSWDAMLGYMWKQWEFVTPTLFQTPGVNADQFINRSRAMMVLLGMALAGVISAWSWELGGRWAALIASALFCLDPNFLGHAPLVKNDVPITLMTAGLMFAIYKAGQRVTLVRAIAIALLMAGAVTVKFSGLLIVAIAIVLLLARALLDRPWLVMGSLWADRLNRLGVAVALIVFGLLISYVGIWACYGFRYAPTTDSRVRLNMPLILLAGVRAQALNQSLSNEELPSERIEAMESALLLPQAVFFADDHQILPQAWLAGLLDTWATTQRRPAFLMGMHSSTGWWYYFPLAMLFKTPLATIAGAILAGIIALRRQLKHRPKRFDRWATLCLAGPVVIYGISALTSNLNLGLRHVFPIYPFLFIWIGGVLAQARIIAPRAAALAIIGLLIGLAIESLSARADYISFFNLASGGSRGGLALLGDSNLDWGQDLLLLQRWQMDHPKAVLSLSYFGGADPNYYVRAQPFSPDVFKSSGENHVLAISASNLQSIYPPAELWPFFDELRKHRPREVLGGTIYLYDLPLRD